MVGAVAADLKTSMTLTRMGRVCTFIDAAGVQEYEDQDYDLEVEITGKRVQVEVNPDKWVWGIEDLTATTRHPYPFGDIELDDIEREHAEKLLLEEYENGKSDR